MRIFLFDLGNLGCQILKLLATFTTVIGNDDKLSDIEKLQYLHSRLGGVALETIRSLEPSNANYGLSI